MLALVEGSQKAIVFGATIVFWARAPMGMIRLRAVEVAGGERAGVEGVRG